MYRGSFIEALELGQLGRRVICLDGGNMTGDGGAMLLAPLDRRLGLIDAGAGCSVDPRGASAIVHADFSEPDRSFQK